MIALWVPFALLALICLVVPQPRCPNCKQVVPVKDGRVCAHNRIKQDRVYPYTPRAVPCGGGGKEPV